jgi:hypothetical protein
MTWSGSRRPSAALVISVIALIVSLGGTAYAGVLLGANSVGNRELRNKSVGTAKLRNGAVTNRKLRSGVITVRKLSKHLVVPKAAFANAAAAAFTAGHASGADSATHAGSSDSAAALTGVNYVRSALTESPNNTLIFGQADCPAGQLPVGGGVWTSSTKSNTQSVNSSWPTRQNTSDPQPDAWAAWVNNINGGTQSFYVYAICVSGSASGSFANDFARRR